MKRMTIKSRLTAWYALFIVLIVLLMFGVLMINDSLQSKDYYHDKLIDAAEDAAREVHLEGGRIMLETQTDSGVRITLLDENGNLLIGGRTFNADFREGILRIRSGNASENWYLLDKAVTLDGAEYWIRCYISTSLTEKTVHSLIVILIVMIPLLLAIVLVGGFLLTKQAFRPLDEIMQTASGISTSGDLRHRFSTDGQYDETRRLAQTFDAMLDRLSQSLENEKQFISDASHELRTPLSVICTQSEYALMPQQSAAEKDAALEVILKRSRQASEMLAQMLMLSRMDYQKLPIQREEIDLSELTENLATEMQNLADERHIRIECAIEKDIVLNCDEILIMRMLINLIENAIHYGRENGFIRIRLGRISSGVQIEIEDDGIGISDADLPNIWRRFYRVNKSGQNGSGLGLSIVKWIAEEHGGSIQVNSSVGKGSCFTVFLPDRKDEVKEK